MSWHVPFNTNFNRVGFWWHWLWLVGPCLPSSAAHVSFCRLCAWLKGCVST